MHFAIDGTNVRLAGGLHRFPPHADGIPSWLQESYAWAQQVVIEAHPEGIIPFRTLPDGVLLRDVLPHDAWAALSNAAPNGDVEAVSALRPWAALFTSVAWFTTTVPGVEPWLLARASEDQKPLFALEEPAQVAELLDAISIDAVASAVIRICTGDVNPQESIEQMYAAWLSGDLTSMWDALVASPVFAQSGIRDSLIFGRNRTWLPALLAGLESPHRTLIVVGALHLCGDQSLNVLLEARGLRLSRLP